MSGNFDQFIGFDKKRRLTCFHHDGSGHPITSVIFGLLKPGFSL
jgi:hypothetical protein